MKKTFALLFSIAVLFAGCERYDHAIQDLNDRIEGLEGASIASVEQQIAAINSSLDDLEAVDVAIEALIKNLQAEAADLQQQFEANAAADAATKQALEAEIEALKALIAALQAKDADLDQQLAGLQTYVDTEIDATEDWAEATFATLTQYEGVQTEMAAVKALIEQNKTDITAAYTEAIATAIANSEASMKQWVNETLAQDYYDIATIDALLGVLTTKVDSVDTALSDSIAAQKSALATAKSELTAAYTEAIEEITKNDGIIDTRIAAAINAAKAELQGKIDAINTEINTIKNRLAALEGKVDALIARIQSIRFMPEYSDGMVELTSDNAPVTLTFLLSPKAAAQAVAAAYANDNSVVAAYLSRTQSRTRAVDAPTAINVTSVAGTAEGMLTVTVSAASLPADYWAAAEEANLFIRISDGNNDVISEMIPTFYTVICNLPKGAIFLGAILKELPDDKSVKAIKFVAGSSADDMNAASAFTHSHYKMPANAKYKIIDATATTPKTLIICTDAEEFIFNADCYNMFTGGISANNKLSEITTIDFGNCINTSNVTNMSYMFSACLKLTSLDLSSFNTEKVTDMFDMFYNCKTLTSLDLSSFNTANVTDMSYMFSRCTALTSLNLTSFNTEKVTDMSNMFSSCSALTSLDLSAFNTANVTNMRSMFNNCTALASLDLSGFNTAEVTTMENMFYNCKALTSLSLSSNFNTAKVTTMYQMFCGCNVLTSLDLSSFNTAEVTNMSSMFRSCSALTSLDIRNFDIGKVTNFTDIFASVGLTLFENETQKAKIKVKLELCEALDSKGVSPGNFAEYVVMDAPM